MENNALIEFNSEAGDDIVFVPESQPCGECGATEDLFLNVRAFARHVRYCEAIARGLAEREAANQGGNDNGESEANNSPAPRGDAGTDSRWRRGDA
jgi:hypothetical protein